MSYFRSIQGFIELAFQNIGLVFDSSNICAKLVEYSLYQPQGHPILTIIWLILCVCLSWLPVVSLTSLFSVVFHSIELDFFLNMVKLFADCHEGGCLLYLGRII